MKISNRLSDSPSCLVADENDPTSQMQEIMKAMGQPGMPDVKPILEHKSQLVSSHIRRIMKSYKLQYFEPSGWDVKRAFPKKASTNRKFGKIN